MRRRESITLDQCDEQRRCHQVGGRHGVQRVAFFAQRGVEALQRQAPVGGAHAAGGVRTAEGRRALRGFDASLREPGNALNPGTTADLVTATLFVALIEGML